MYRLLRTREAAAGESRGCYRKYSRGVLRLLAAAVTVILLSGPGVAQDQLLPTPGKARFPHAKWGANLYLGRTAKFLGSTEARDLSGISLSYARVEPRLRFRTIPAEWVKEFYYNLSYGDAYAPDRGHAVAYGLLNHGRWRWPKRGVAGFFLDFGTGLQFGSRRIYDLPSRINFVTMIGVGVAYGDGYNEMTVSLRLLHISNAGLVPPNPGQNQLALIVGYRF
jgi:hypothetical protein